ncbi:MAG: prkC 9, partial [Planctomycetaceae bacterium]|nr:prkC 9 [Planctomycetaceae bacterium]
ISPNLDPKLIDFGFVRSESNSNKQSVSIEFAGTRTYMSPEAMTGILEKVTSKSDIWSLGVILFELLSNELPFGEKPHPERMRLAHMLKLREISPNLPEPLIKIVQRCLEWNPKRRFSAEELVNELAGLQRRGANHRVSRLPLVLDCTTRVHDLTRRGIVLLAIAALCVLLLPLMARFYVIAVMQASIANGETLSKRQLLHVNRMGLAQLSFESGFKSQAIAQLEACFVAPGETDMRGREWAYLWHLVHSDAMAFKGPEGTVTNVAFSPDGRFLASSSWDKTVRIWGIDDGQERLVIRTDNPHPQVAWSPDGTQFAAGHHWIGTWNTASGMALRRFQNITDKGVECLLYSPDQSLLVAGLRDETSNGNKDHSVAIFEVATGKLVKELSGHSGAVRCLGFVSNGQLLVSGAGDGQIIVWNKDEWKAIRKWAAHGGTVSGLAVSPDQHIVASVGWDATVRLWDTKLWQSQAAYEIDEKSLRAVSFFPDGETLAIAGESGNVVFLDPKTGNRKYSCLPHPNMGWGLAVSPDGACLAASGERPRIPGNSGAGGGGGFIKLWNVKSGDAQKLTTSRDHRATDQFEMPRWSTSLASLTSPDRVVAGLDDGTLQVWDLTQEISSPAKTVAAHRSPTRAVVAIPHTDLLASASEDGQISIWDTAEFKLKKQVGQIGEGVLAMCASDDGRQLVASTIQNRLLVWNVAFFDSPRTLDLGPTPALVVAASLTGDWIATGDGFGKVCIRSAASGVIQREFHDHSGWMTALLFSDDGNWLFSADSDGVVCARKLDSVARVVRFAGHFDRVMGLAYTDDGRLVSASWDKTVKFWDLDTGLDLLTLRGATHALNSVSVTPKSERLFVGVEVKIGPRSGRILGWRAAKPLEVWDQVLQQHSIADAPHDENLVLVRCAWTLSCQRAELGPVDSQNKSRWLQQGRDILIQRMKKLPKDSRVAKWISRFEGQLQAIHTP